MKTKVFLVLLVLVMVFMGCELQDLGPIRVATSECSWLTTESVTLEGTITGNKEPYQSFVYGFYFSTDEALVAIHQAEIFYTQSSDNLHFYVSLADLEPGTTYYYCAWVMLNATEYVYGEVKSFTTPTKNLVEMPFSVSPTKKVYFSSGNLQYHPLNNQWRFAKYQYDYIGSDNKYIAPDYDGWIDLFGWGTGDNPTLSSTVPGDYKEFVDWGVNSIQNDSLTTWRTLTSDEWDYLCNKRPNAKWLCKYVYVEGKLGLMLLPDGTDIHPGANSRMNKYYLLTLERSGKIFLPAAGRRYEGTYHESGGLYWTSSGYGNSGYRFFLSSSAEEMNLKTMDKCNGYSVRLVRDVE